MSNYNELNEIFTNDQPKETARTTRPKILTSFRKESLSSVTSRTSEATVTSKLPNGVDTDTQTDWSWIQDMELINKIRREGADLFEEIVNDLVQSSDSESEPEVVKPPPTPKPKPVTKIETVGPPKILQFNPEVKKTEIPARETSPPLSIDSDQIENLGNFMLDFNIHIKGGRTCEFCENITKPWPTINRQESNNPETLHCCNDYQEFVEALIQYQIEKEQATKKYLMDNENNRNNIPNAKARKLAEERAELRNMQRMVEKHKRMERIENLRMEKQQLQQQLQAKQLNNKPNEQTKMKNLKANLENQDTEATKSTSRLNNSKKQQQHRNDAKEHEKLLAKKLARFSESARVSNLSHTLTVDEVSIPRDTPLSFHDNFLNQNRSINYQLSNLKYLQDGWTVRPSTPIDIELMSLDEEEYNFNARSAADPIEDKNHEKPMLIRKYKNDENCLILFPDGTGNILYPSGRVAVVITEVAPGMHLVSAFSDDETNPTLIASFDPYGNACANFLNGQARMILSPLGGLEMDADGNRKKRWLWWEQEEHVHAPPFQPLIFSLNNNLSIKVINQEKIFVHFYAENQVCKFRVGSKIKIKRPESMPTSFKIELSELYLKKKRKRIEDLLKLMNNEMHYGVKLPRIVNPKEMPKLSQSLDFLSLSRDKKESKKQKSNKFITVP